MIYCFISFYRGGNWRPERLSKLPEITQLARAELGFRSRSALSYVLCSFLNTTVVSGRPSQVGLGFSLFYTHTARLSVSTPAETQLANQEGPFCSPSLCEHRSRHRHLPSSSNSPSQHPCQASVLLLTPRCKTLIFFLLYLYPVITFCLYFSQYSSFLCFSPIPLLFFQVVIISESL